MVEETIVAVKAKVLSPAGKKHQTNEVEDEDRTTASLNSNSRNKDVSDEEDEENADVLVRRRSQEDGGRMKRLMQELKHKSRTMSCRNGDTVVAERKNYTFISIYLYYIIYLQRNIPKR